MSFEDMTLICEATQIDLADFLTSADIPVRAISIWQNSNSVPESIATVFCHFVQETVIQHASALYIEERDAFFEKARKAGLEIKNNKVEVPLSNSGPNTEFDIFDKEMQHVRFTLE